MNHNRQDILEWAQAGRVEAQHLHRLPFNTPVAKGQQRLSLPDLCRVQPHPGFRRIMRFQHARRFDAPAFFA